jgi:ornithine carbamoyltransferase
MSFLSLLDYDADTVRMLVGLASQVKENQGGYAGRLSGKSLACVFEKPSTRTRVSFELAVKQLGGF